MTAIGYICIVVAAIWILYKVYVSYTSFGGTIMATVYDAAVFPPPLAAFGLYAVLRLTESGWPIWAYVVLWLGLTAAVAIAIRVAEDIGDRRR